MMAFSVVPAAADPVSLILSDDEQRAVVRMLDAALRAKGIDAADDASYLLNKLRSAPRMTPPKPPVAPEPPKPPEPPQ